MTLGNSFGWRTLFYEALLPALGLLQPSAAESVLEAFGRAAGRWHPRRAELIASVRRAAEALGVPWDAAAVADSVAGRIPRFLARDYPLDRLDDAELARRFDVSGAEHLAEALAGGKGAILLGCHYGGHLAAVHWLVRQGIPPRLLVQRPRHVSRRLRRWFDAEHVPHPPSGFFLRLRLPPEQAVTRLLRARQALRDGLAVYLNGDIPWSGANALRGRFLGHERPFLAVWADLAALTGAPVVPLFCSHRPCGRFTLVFDPPRTIQDGEQPRAVMHYLARLESVIRVDPADAVVHLTWPGYAPDPTPPTPSSETPRPAFSTPSGGIREAAELAVGMQPVQAGYLPK